LPEITYVNDLYFFSKKAFSKVSRSFCPHLKIFYAVPKELKKSVKNEREIRLTNNFQEKKKGNSLNE